jgi:mevalonate kinase
MTRLVKRARGKVILLGEHAVVYGVPAIAAGIERGASASASASDEATLTVGDLFVRAADESEIGRGYAALLAELGAPPLATRVDLELPPGCGLGASAAIAVAAARAVLDALGSAENEETERRVLAAATAWERVFHGNPSGIDAAAAASGGCIWFTRADGPSPIALGAPLRLAIAVAGPPASTKQMVDGVAKLRERRPEVFDKSLDGIRSLVTNARRCLEAGDGAGLGQLMDYNQMLLSGMFVSTEGIERACRIAREAGALGAKLTGAGGGGCVVALIDNDATPVLDAWKNAGIDGFTALVRADAAPGSPSSAAPAASGPAAGAP